MRTKQEVINFLESKVGTKVPCKGNASLDSQCVTLIKALMEFLGVPEPYKARGHAKTVVSAYLSEGIAQPGVGFVSVFSNKNMGGGYGHIWCNAGDGDGVFYESNGVKPLMVTKGKTYDYDAVCNFDKYIKENDMEEVPKETFEDLVRKSSEYDKFVDAGYKNVDEVLTATSNLLNEIDNLSGQLNECQNQAQQPPLQDGVKWKLNGKTEETIENGVKIIKNYTIGE